MIDDKISPSKVLYIKLGSKGKWEHECIHETQTLRFGYNSVSHEACLNGDWEKVRDSLNKIRDDQGAITRDLNQIKEFYTAEDDVLWITFHGNVLWWCFSKPKIILHSDNRKTRSVIGEWKNKDINGKILSNHRLKGSLVSIQGFQGTICSVKDSKYTIRKINAEEDPEVKKAEETFQKLKEDITPLIKRLDSKDFEILIDLMFRQAGWERVGELGGTQKTLDLDLISPIDKERYCIQIKSKSNLAKFEKYKNKFKDMEGYSRFYYVVHSPEPNLENAVDIETEEFKLMLPDEISHLAIKYGLADWIIGKF